MRRREFIAGFGAVATAPAFWSRTACAQHAASTAIGFLSGASPDGYSERLRGFRQGLQDTGFIEGTNISIDYRWAEGHADRLPALAADLVRRRVAVIAAPGSVDLAFAAGSATKTVPIVFLVADDPVKLGLVTSVARPGGNLTGVNIVNDELAAKRLEFLRLLVPGATRVAVVVNPEDTVSADSTVRDSESAALTIGVEIQILKASTSHEIDAAFATFERERPDALIVAGGAFLNSRRVQLVHLASYYRIPTAYWSRDYPDAGGLMSYGSNVTDAYRQVGNYTGRIVRGEQPGNLPVIQPTKFELVINHQTARMLRLSIPPTLLALADEVIE
jgi:putative tryptophan/tyrosine transport system substrate-binding protein